MFQQSQIKDLLRDFDCHTVSSVKDNDIGRMGRPYGGCAVIWKKSIPMQVTPVETTTGRLCAITIDMNGAKCLIVNVYMSVLDELNPYRISINFLQF